MRLLSVACFVVSVLSVAACGASAQEIELGEPAPLAVSSRVEAAAVPAPPTPPASGEAAWAEMIRATVIAALPEKTVDDKHWGHQTTIFSRYEIKTRKGRLSMRPRTNEVNHGFWQRYTVTMLKPQETLQLKLSNVQKHPDGQVSLTMQIELLASVETEFEQWVYGVKGINGQSDANVTLAVEVDGAFDLRAEHKEGELLPSLRLVPAVSDLKLKVRDINARKVGVLGGWAAKQIGDNSRSTVNTILNASEGRILKDLRRKIEKNQDRLRVSPSRWLNGDQEHIVPPTSK